MKNQVFLIGRIGNDLDPKIFENGSILNISLGVNDDYLNNEGQKVERTQWINLVAKNKMADMLTKHFSKGNQLALSGKLVTRSYEKEGIGKIYITEVEIQNITWEACLTK